jgi:hypothetical protein
MADLISTFSDARLSSPGDIFYSTPEYIYTVPVTIASGQSLTRGTPIAKQTANGLFYKLDLTASDGTQSITGILVDDVDASAGNVNGEQYVHGVFNLVKLPDISNYATSPLTAGSYNSGMIIIKEAVR